MRIASIAITALAFSAIMQAAGPSSVTYLQGNLSGFDQNQSGTLDLTKSRVMSLHTKTGDLQIPYEAVMKSQSTTTVVAGDSAPFYKVWHLGKKLMPPEPVEQVTMEFKDSKGGSTSMTIEMAKPVAEKLAARLKKADERKAAANGAWWGDQLWKTPRNEDQWKQASEVAERYQK
jgi:hypothetical protein